jgi:hypothetical protein
MTTNVYSHPHVRYIGVDSYYDDAAKILVLNGMHECELHIKRFGRRSVLDQNGNLAKL